MTELPSDGTDKVSGAARRSGGVGCGGHGAHPESWRTFSNINPMFAHMVIS
jgi:hypothetical protein